MKTIRIKYLDWWNGFDPSQHLVNSILQKHFNVVESEIPDYVISSVYTKEALNYDCIRLFITPENFCPDFNLFDYAIGFENLKYGDRYVMAPNYILNLKYQDSIKKMKEKHLIGDMSHKSDFCSYVVSNGVGDEIRTRFFEELCKYKKVNSGGTYQNNIGMPEGIPDKLDFQKKHRFSICFENSSHDGYITEKLMEGFAAQTIPIYWGAHNVTDVFNKNAMVIVKDENDISRAVEEIKAIDNNYERYMEMLRQPALVNSDYIETIYENLEQFLIHIFSVPIGVAKRRPKSATVLHYYRDPHNAALQSDVRTKMHGFFRGVFK